jgi:hypothetical protein
MQIWYCPDCHTGDPPLAKLPSSVIANVWGSIDYAASACKLGHPTMLSMAQSSAHGAGWYLPPYGDCRWPGAWTRDPDAELEALGCTSEEREKLVLGGSAASWLSDQSYFDVETWEGTMAVAERLWVGSPKADPDNVTNALPRLAVQSCRMRMRGFAVSPYKPSTWSLGGEMHWCTGGRSFLPGSRARSAAYNGNECFPCPAGWAES